MARTLMPFAIADDGCRLHYDVRGEGAQRLVLIPGLGGDGRFWDDVVEPLQDRFRIVVIDHRGAGRSDRPDEPYTIDRIATDVLHVMDALSWDRASLVGHSTGGTVVQTLAIDHPQRVDRIVVSGSWERPDARFRSLFEVRLALLEHGLLRAYQALTHIIGYTPAYIEANTAVLARAIEDAPVKLEPIQVTSARIRMLLDFDRSADLHRITAPALVISAPDDEMIPPHHGRALAAAIGGSELVSLLGGHFFPRVDPVGYAYLVAQHVACM